MCQVLAISASGYYAWCRRSESAHAHRDRQLRVLVRASFDASNGSPRIHEDLLEQRVRVTETADRFASCAEAKMELFDNIEVFYNQRRRHSTLGQISPAEFERRKNEEGVDPMENRTRRGFPQAPHPSSVSLKEEKIMDYRLTAERTVAYD